MEDDSQKQQSGLESFLKSELWSALFSLGLVILLFGACAGGPFLLAPIVGAWGSLLLSIAAVLCWIRLVPPMPGLIMGLISLSGLASLVICVVFWIYRIINS